MAQAQELIFWMNRSSSMPAFFTQPGRHIHQEKPPALSTCLGHLIKIKVIKKYIKTFYFNPLANKYTSLDPFRDASGLRESTFLNTWRIALT